MLYLKMSHNFPETHSCPSQDEDYRNIVSALGNKVGTGRVYAHHEHHVEIIAR